MVAFRNAVRDTRVENWWDNGLNQIAFSRGNKGFIAINAEGRDLDVILQVICLRYFLINEFLELVF